MRMKRLFLPDYQQFGNFFGVVNIKLNCKLFEDLRYIPLNICDVNHPGYKKFSPSSIGFNFHYYHSSSYCSSSSIILQGIGIYYYTHPFHREKTIPRVKRSYTLYEEDGHHIESVSLKMDCLILYGGESGFSFARGGE